ncbi:hypothetical protein [Spirosoma lituiforme]
MYSLLPVFFNGMARSGQLLRANSLAQAHSLPVHNQNGVIQIPESGIPPVSFLLFTGRQ